MESMATVIEEKSTEIASPIDDMEHTTQKLMRSYAISAFRFMKPSDHIFVTLSFIVSLNNVLRFPAILSESGGVLFLIPYMLCLIFITTPIIYLENALGQYSSMPPLQLFYHLCPAFSGIGFVLTFIAFFKSLILSYTSLDVFYAFKSLSAAFSINSRKLWLECVNNGHPSCYDPHIKCDERNGIYQYYSKCYNLGKGETFNYTLEQAFITITTTSEALRELPTQIYLYKHWASFKVIPFSQEIRKPGTPSPYLIVSATVSQAIIAIIAMLGMRVYAKLSRFIVIFPQICLFISLLYAFHQLGFWETLNVIAEGFKPNIEELMTARAWGGALLHAVVATNLLDGSFITLAAMKPFRNNFMRDTLIVVAYGMLTNIFSCLVIFSVAGVGYKLIFPLHPERIEWLWAYGQYTAYIVLPLIFAKTTFGSLLLSSCYVSIFLLTIGAQLMALEMIIMTIYRAAPRTKYMDIITLRNLIVGIYFHLMLFYAYAEATKYYVVSGLEYFYFAFAQSLMGVFEIFASVHCYHLKRLIVNLQTMLGTSSNIFRKHLESFINWYFMICWYCLTPVLCLVGIIAQQYILQLITIFSLYAAMRSEFFTTRGMLAYVTMLGPLLILIILLVYRVIKACQKGEDLHLLFKSDLQWAPELAADRRQAFYDERAARVIS